MKKILFVLFILGAIIISCGHQKKESNNGQHVHEDGTTHSHEQNQELKPDQEAFEVTEDNASEVNSHDQDNREHDHDHNSEAHEHSHSH